MYVIFTSLLLLRAQLWNKPNTKLTSYIYISVYKADLTVFQNNRFVDLSSNADTEYRGYVSHNYKTNTTYNIGRKSYTGTGKIGSKVINPDPGILPSDSGFPDGSTVAYDTDSAYKRIEIKLNCAEQAKNCTGAFYVEAVGSENETLEITTTKSADEGKEIITKYCYQ